MAQAYLGYRDGDADTDYGAFFDPEMAALPGHVVTALQHGPQADQVLLEFDRAAMLLDEGYQPTETGYGWLRTGGFQVSVRTDMPGVTPQMWQWWFGWHGSQTRRYKLWHPRAHASARWADGGGDGSYVGRTSLIEEYLGSAYAKAAIRFSSPLSSGWRRRPTRSPSAHVWVRRRLRSTSDGSSTTCAPHPTARRCAHASGWADRGSPSAGWPGRRTA